MVGSDHITVQGRQALEGSTKAKARRSPLLPLLSAHRRQGTHVAWFATCMTQALQVAGRFLHRQELTGCSCLV